MFSPRIKRNATIRKRKTENKQKYRKTRSFSTHHDKHADTTNIYLPTNTNHRLAILLWKEKVRPNHYFPHIATTIVPATNREEAEQPASQKGISAKIPNNLQSAFTNFSKHESLLWHLPHENSTPRYQHIRTGLDQQPSRITVHPTVYLYQGFRPASVYHTAQFPHFI